MLLFIFQFLFSGSLFADGSCVGDCTNGQGTYTWSNGDKYTGIWENGKQKKGEMICANGNKFSAEWKDDVIAQDSQLIYPNGDKFDGGWTGECKANSQGIMTLANGSKQVGQWDDGKSVASCIGNCFDGQGTLTFVNGEKYSGGWKNGIKEGQGTFSYTNGDLYIGEFKGGLHVQNLQVPIIYANGNKYYGDWGGRVDGFYLDGQGKMVYASGDQLRRWLEK